MQEACGVNEGIRQIATERASHGFVAARSLSADGKVGVMACARVAGDHCDRADGAIANGRTVAFMRDRLEGGLS